MKKVTIFYFEGCPNFGSTADLIRQVLTEVGVRAVVKTVEVRGSDDAQRLRFFGSPTVHVDGSDVDPAAAGRDDYGFGCRRYDGSGNPSREMIEDALTKREEP